MSIPEPGRQSAHIFLDVVSVFDPDDDDAAAMNLALKRFNDVGAISAKFDDETDVLDLDASDLIGGAALVIQRLVTLYSSAAGIDPASAIVEVREFLDDPRSRE